MIEMKIIGESLTDIRNEMTKMLMALDNDPVVEIKSKKKKATKKKKKEEEVKKEEVKKEEEVSLKDQVLACLQEVNSKLGLMEAKRILNQFNANRFSEIESACFSDFISACKEALNA